MTGASLAPKYDPKEVEDKRYSFWEGHNYFHSEPDPDRKSFTIVIPPPNITGALHMGHALNTIIQDVLIRWRRMDGHNALWMPGTDHAGIATQNVVERELIQKGLNRKEMGRERFLKAVWEWRDEYGSTIIKQLKKLGSSCDWERERFTMDEGLSAAVREAFVRLWEKGLIYRGKYIINWCPRCQTALSDDEVDHETHDGHLWYIKYPFRDESHLNMIVATTRPETMLGDVAVAVNPEDGRYKDFVGETLVLPAIGREIPVIADVMVDKAFGTGIVKITPAHDPNDFEMSLNHGLEPIVVMEGDGTMNKNAGEYAGMDRYECREALIEDLRHKELIAKIEPYTHSVGHCYRCHTVIEPRLSDQWFVKMKPLAEAAIKATNDDLVTFYPARWTKVYLDWLENVRDWCVSRQIWWGHQIPAWHCKDCGEINVSRDTPTGCSKCQGTNLDQDPDVLDTWFSSALWPFSTLGWPEDTPELGNYYPTSVLVTDRGIIYFW
ncbi:MAG: valine--tRNA ligase, partial [Candidatus Brocadiales bacterium]|nr:valine--tRNA ligase [Candidatus Bathyanammoxibius sp.]